MKWDIFLSHASEDKADFVEPLAEELSRRGLEVWYDDRMLKIGQSLRRSIDEGLRQSRYGVVVISRNFLAKEWPQKELDGLTAREAGGDRLILPVWHDISAAAIREYSPTLADRKAVSSNRGVQGVADAIIDAMQGNLESSVHESLEITEVISGLTREDSLVLKIACQHLREEDGDLIEPGEIEDQITAAGLETEQLFDSIEMLASGGLMKSNGAMGSDRALSFFVTTRGFRVYAEHFVPRYRNLVTVIARAIVDDDHYRSSSIAEQLKCDHAVVKFTLRDLHDQDALRLSSDVGPEEEVSSVHVKLKRIARLMVDEPSGKTSRNLSVIDITTTEEVKDLAASMKNVKEDDVRSILYSLIEIADTHRDEDIVREAIFRLELSGFKEAGPSLLRIADDPNRGFSIRQRAMLGLASLHDRDHPSAGDVGMGKWLDWWKRARSIFEDLNKRTTVV